MFKKLLKKQRKLPKPNFIASAKYCIETDEDIMRELWIENDKLKKENKKLKKQIKKLEKKITELEKRINVLEWCLPYDRFNFL